MKARDGCAAGRRRWRTIRPTTRCKQRFALREKSPSSSLWRELACNRVNSTGITTSNETTGMRGTARKPRKVGTLACHRVDRRPGAALSTRRRTAPTSRRRRRRRLGDHATSRSSPLWWTKRKRRRRRRRVFRSIEPVRLRCSARYRYVEREEKTKLCSLSVFFFLSWKHKLSRRSTATFLPTDGPL